MSTNSNIFDALREDHDFQRQLVDRLIETAGDSEERTRLFAELRHSLEAHAAAEERYFYSPLMQSDLTQDKARHSVAEHKELDDFVEQLEEYDNAASQWLVTARELHHRLHHHLEEEEREVFQAAGKVLSEAEKTSLADEYRSMMDQS